LLKAKSNEQKGTTVALPLKASAEAIASNLLVGVTEETTLSQTDGGYVNYILSDGSHGPRCHRHCASSPQHHRH
ncbi:MAG: hypothetical protein ACSW8D_13790, partial [Prevotella sp.]